MKKKTYKVKLAGKRWSVRFTPHMKAHYGVCDHNKREIVIAIRQTPEEMLNTVVHEALHAILPYCSEEFVHASADELANLVEILELD